MKTIGLLGGLSSVATAEYYRLLNERVNARLGGHQAPEIVLRSVNFGVFERCIRTAAWDEAAAYLSERARQVERAGADFLLLAANTPHRVAPQIEAAVGIPFVHIVDVTADAARAAGTTKLGLLGTAPVMAPGFYAERFAVGGVEVMVPEPADRDLVHASIFGELTRGVVADATRTEYLRIVDGLVARGAQGLVLGCTELGLLLGPDDVPGLPLFDTTSLHVDRAVELALAD
ncbi:aspartate/glutamate racemase family protein [Actinocatenispora rupis]|uniref:Aspartate racemase n=1 Tax=Actinocatenispora rupis TaxID=519421 RepID=A0A8J3J697_9ACTN|nr:aspartate/glutamate racemase family protein [Actinocatenispora rupis]GID10977.1 aspartate racemase [Actinocatenispora rupis]